MDPHNIKPSLFKIGGQSSRGYERSDFEDTWTRYVSPPDPPCKSVTPLPSAENKGFPGNTCAEVTLPQPKPLPQNPRISADGNGVTLGTPLRGGVSDEADPDDPSSYPNDSDLPLSPETREANRFLGPSPIPPILDRRPSRMKTPST